MQPSVMLICVLFLVFLQGAIGRPENTNLDNEPKTPCERPDAYCQGETFEGKVTLKNRLVTCDVVPNPKEKCCMPQAKHKVCYNILVDGNRLNFGPSRPMADTNFSALCEALLNTLGLEPGKYATVYIADGRGTLRYNFNSFDVASVGGQYIQHLACSIKE